MLTLVHSFFYSTHPWFVIDAPAYLFPPEELSSKSTSFDSSIVQEVCDKLKVTRDDVVSVLMSQSNAYDPLKVAYDLILDNRRMEGDSRMIVFLSGLLSDSSPPT